MNLGMVIPFAGRCGIKDYTKLITAEFNFPFDLILNIKNTNNIKNNILHIQYEPTLFREGRKNIFPEFMKKHKLPKVVTVHEVYDSNPFISERPKLNSIWDFKNKLRQLKYDIIHSLERVEDTFAKNDFFADSIIVHTSRSKEILIEKGCTVEKIKVISHPVFVPPRDFSRTNKYSYLPKNFVLIFGFISTVNDYNLLMDTAELMPETVFVLAGGGRRDEEVGLVGKLKDEIEERKLEHRIILTGYVDKADMPELFSMASIYLSLSIFKTSSGSLARALGSNLPCLSLNLPYVSEINKEINAVVTYKKRDAEDLSLKIQHLLQPINNSNARKAVRQYAKEHSVVDFVNQHLKIYSTLAT